ncbi:MAG: hypothetical protein Q4D38_09785 [Planctomycetia bacterium]|nr:hypothetical protein [Planctomycetia bacterium]
MARYPDQVRPGATTASADCSTAGRQALTLLTSLAITTIPPEPRTKGVARSSRWLGESFDVQSKGCPTKVRAQDSPTDGKIPRRFIWNYASLRSRLGRISAAFANVVSISKVI